MQVRIVPILLKEYFRVKTQVSMQKSKISDRGHARGRQADPLQADGLQDSELLPFAESPVGVFARKPDAQG